jgi:hypothetical protein
MSSLSIGKNFMYSRIANDNIPGKFNEELTAINDLISSLDLMYNTNDENSSVLSLVNSQYAKLKVEEDELKKEIDSITAQITAKETEFVDIKKKASESYIINKLFTQQDYFTMMLFIAYIILSVSFYWKMTVIDGFSTKSLLYFIIGWMILTVMLFRLFDRFV